MSPHLYEVRVLLRVAFKPQPTEQILLSALQQLVEDVEVPLPGILVNNAGFLNQVAEDVPTDRGSLREGGNMANNSLAVVATQIKGQHYFSSSVSILISLSK